ncbi:MAG: F-type H+-transporting ATPase subunit epsilon [Candidatus Tokpelaia sp. JSC161]|jgi:F-type H+-transporting ATPase subunit epsilon|nr:MAG: F-type H+-transporting ATPase subunit epsilon [Candidatus Tokpelaia sp. JSC161]
MRESFHFDLVTPNRILLSKAVAEVIVPGANGYLTVLAGHSPMLIRVIPGFLHVRFFGEAEQIFVILDGFFDITTGDCSLLSDSVISLSNFDEIESYIAAAHAALGSAPTDEIRNKAEECFSYLKSVLKEKNLVNFSLF